MAVLVDGCLGDGGDGVGGGVVDLDADGRRARHHVVGGRDVSERLDGTCRLVLLWQDVLQLRGGGRW